MKMTVNSGFFGGGKYTAPEIEMYESVVERGFEASLGEMGINDWENDSEGLNF